MPLRQGFRYGLALESTTLLLGKEGQECLRAGSQTEQSNALPVYIEPVCSLSRVVRDRQVARGFRGLVDHHTDSPALK